MSNSKQLHSKATEVYARATAKTELADKASARADAYEKAGNILRSGQESKIANRYYQDALDLEKQAIEYDREAAALEAKAIDLERQEEKMTKNCQQQIEKLESEQRALRGDR